MDSNNKKGSCHTSKGGHKGHGWMMILCALIMIGIPILMLSPSINLFSFSFLSSALLPIILCLVMHGVMMKFMMSQYDKGTKHQADNAPSADTSLDNEKKDEQFKA
ncbi:hypothetical protein KP803_14540 [Vibrio sp. ZSDE26]|uniref:DUF2933 domain-containing protein n=1 Tax=Vibrio amylolyticus TaxID=2847292 RepID=A0A9X1XKP7_9VIBR|nr:hypothetical protein [Vibrio amylolyticus]MCK6264496.1 hypothetical protein [Vibrio amylolyticus]